MMNKPVKLDGAVKLTNWQQKMLKRARPRERKEKAPAVKAVEPTPEQQAKNKYMGAGMAKRKIPVILQMLKAEQITQDEYKKLAYYREQASLADTSPVRSNCDFSVRGSGMGPSTAIVSAQLETGRMEADMGNLCHVVRAVAVDDLSLRQWVVNKYPCVTPKRVQFAMLDFKFGVGRIVV